MISSRAKSIENTLLLCLQISYFNINIFMFLPCSAPMWHVSSLIRREGDISLEAGVINPRSHSIRCHAQFVLESCVLCKQAETMGPTAITPE